MRPTAGRRSPPIGGQRLQTGANWRRRAFILAASAATIAGGLWLGRGEDRVGRIRDTQRMLLEGRLTGRAAKRAIDQTIRTVDRMRPDELKEVKRSLDEQWESLVNEDVAAYLVAAADEQRAILDRGIDRGVVYRELQFAVNPRARTREDRGPRKPRAAAPDNAAAAGAEDGVVRRNLKRYRDGLVARARERGIAPPALP